MNKFSSPFQNANLYGEYLGDPVTPNDGTDLTLPSGNSLPIVGLKVTGAGNVNVDLPNGGTAVLTGLTAGQTVDVAVRRIRSTGTTATGIFVLYANRPN